MSKESIEQLIEAEARKLAEKMVAEQQPVKPGERVLQVGHKVFIRTVTHYYTGRITLMEDDAIVLEDAAWIACTKRFNNSLTTGDFDEVEPFPNPVEVERGAIVDSTTWPHELPRVQK